MTNTPANPNANGLTPNATDPTGLTPTTPQGLTPNGQKTSIDTLPADIQEYIKELRTEAKNLKKDKEAEIAAKQLAEQAALVEQGKFKELAEQHGKRVQELEPIAERYTALSSVLAEQIKAQTKDWPKEVLDLLPSADAEPDVAKRLQHVQRLQVLVNKMAEHARGSLPGNAPNPTPSSGELPRDQQIKAFKERGVKSGKYNI